MDSTHQKSDDLEAFREIANDVDESEFVPYACLYDPCTVLTKNGELLQTLRVSGLSYENIKQEALDLRALLRQVIREHIPNDSFAVWFHTIRSQQSLIAPGDFSGFAKQVNEAWVKAHRLEQQYTNDVYITIVHEGQDARILSPMVFLRGLIPRLDLRWRNAYLDNIHAALDTVVTRLEEALQPFGAERLGIVEEDGVPHSDLLRFLHRVINFSDQPVPIAALNLSHQLTSGDITFSYNTMEVRSDTGQRRFAAILTLKDYKEKSLASIDRFLKLPMEFMVTQCVNFVQPKKALEQYQEIKRLQDAAEERELPKLTELESILASKTGRATDFGEQQLSLFIVADSVRQLERNIRHTVNFLGRHGILCFREDLRLEECYWAQMPGNFEFVTRMQPTAISHMAGFANLYNHPVGLREHNQWGPAVTTVPTANGTPYFFNFHIDEVGHTLVVGRPGAGKSTLVNFLLTQSLKFQPVIHYFDISNRHQEWIETVGGRAYRFAAPGNALAALPPPLNPFSLPPSEGTIRFTQRWLSVLLRCGGQALDEVDKQALAEGLRLLYSDGQPRHLSRLRALVQTLSPATAEKFEIWVRGGAYGHVFDHEQDLFDQPGDIRGFHLAEVIQDGRVIAPLLSYLLQRLTLQLDERPTIIVLDEAWQILGQTHIAADIEGWMKRLTEMNAIALLKTSQIEEIAEIPFSQPLMQHIATELYLPDDMADDIYTDSFGLTELEVSYLELLRSEQRHVLLKRMDNTMIAEMDLSGLGALLRVLSGEPAANASRAA
jgi:type IV secretion system protein VirB4